MPRHQIKSLTLLLLLLTSTLTVLAQPGGGFGGGFPSGHPPVGMPPGGFRGGRPPMSEQDRERMNRMNDQKAERSQQVKQKKTVREGSTFKVIGTLRDSASGELIPYVNVAILAAEDSSMVKGGSTNLDGYFELTGIYAGRYLLRVSAIGYRNIYHPFTVENNTALGTIRLQPGATQLKEVEITAERPLYAMDGEKMVYNVSEDPTIQTGTTSDALQNAPGVEVDIEGNITLRGVSSVEIWVNDKPSKLTEENLKTYLETLPANALARIETITNPSAKYATEAEAVINIVTSAHIKSNNFISFGINGSTQPSVSPWLSYTWANERLTVNLFASGRYNYRENSSASWDTVRRDNAAHTGYDNIRLQSDTSNSWNKGYGGNLGLHIDYALDSMTDLSFFSNLNLNGGNSFSGSFNSRNELLAATLYEYGDTSNTSNLGLFGMLGADYTHKFDREGHNLRVGLSGNFSRNSRDQFFNRHYATTFTGLNYDKYYATAQNSGSLRANARYNRPYSRQGEMSYGISVSHSSNLNTYGKLRMDYADSSYSIIDTLRQYTFIGNETDATADVNWTRRWGGFTLELGLGGGIENTAFAYQNDCFPNDSAYLFLTVNPSIHMSYRTQSLHNFKLNYSLRMRTPGENQLTTFRTYGEDSYSTGNPNLRPYYTHNAEAGWTKFFMRFGSVSAEAYARYSANEISSLTDVTETDDPWIGRAISYSMPYNMGSSYRLGGSANVTYRPSGFFNLRLYANLYDYGYAMQYSENGHNLNLNNNKLSWSLRLNCWAKVFDRYQIHASANYSSPTIGLLSETKARYFLNCGVRSDFLNRKLSVYVNVQDIFNWGKTMGGGNLNTNPYYLRNSSTYTINSRFISAGLTFRFGKMELERNSTLAEEDSSTASD